MASNDEFDLQVIADNFIACKISEDAILIDEFINAYRELCSFFELLGTVFSFVVSDVHKKIHILEQHRKSSLGDNYISVQGMIQYEIDNNLTECKINKIDNGSRTLLRLHRALDFIVQFLDETQKAEDSAPTSTIATNVYTKTLGNYHNFLIRKAALLAMYMLPDKKGLLAKAKKYDYEKTNVIVRQIIEAINPVYGIVQKLYEERNILNLP